MCNAIARPLQTRLTDCPTCTTASAFNAGNEFRLPAAVGAGDIFLLPSAATSRLHKTHCTGCEACTTGIAFNGGSESRLLMPVGRAPDVARGPSALSVRKREIGKAGTPAAEGNRKDRKTGDRGNRKV